MTEQGIAGMFGDCGTGRGAPRGMRDTAERMSRAAYVWLTRVTSQAADRRLNLDTNSARSKCQGEA
jgi:hypothetical protein